PRLRFALCRNTDLLPLAADPARLRVYPGLRPRVATHRDPARRRGGGVHGHRPADQSRAARAATAADRPGRSRPRIPRRDDRVLYPHAGLRGPCERVGFTGDAPALNKSGSDVSATVTTGGNAPPR